MTLKESAAGAELLPALARTADANGTGVDTWAKGRSREALVLLSVGAASGTSPTLDVKIQHSDDNSTWSDLAGAAFPQRTAAGAVSEINIKGFKRYIRAVHDVGGTSPSFTAAVLAVFGSPLDEPI